MIIKILEDETQIMERIYDVNSLESYKRYFPNKPDRVKKALEDIYISDYITTRSKKRLLIGFQLLIIAAHLVFFILRIFHI